MERIVFLVEETGERVSCLLNPESVTMRRLAGLTDLPFESMPLNANLLSDTPVALTGGGRTEVELALLFDVDLAGTGAPVEDVRTLTMPLWRLTENGLQIEDRHCVPTVWILWGKEWSVHCVIEAIAERFENISAAGAPRRSWISLRARRISDQTLTPPADTVGVPTSKPLPSHEAPSAVVTTGDGSTEDGFEGVRPDTLAATLLGDPARWRELCDRNGIDDPLRIPAGTTLTRDAGASP